MPGQPAPPLQIVVIHSPEDAALKDALLQHLSALRRFEHLAVWSTDDVIAGDDWRREVEGALGRADVAILLVSAPFLASDFINDVQLPRILERHAAGGARVIPVLVRSCDWAAHPVLRRFGVLPRSGVAIAGMPGDYRDRGFVEVVQEIARLAAGESTWPAAAPAKPVRSRLRRLVIPLALVVAAVLSAIIALALRAKQDTAPPPACTYHVKLKHLDGLQHGAPVKIAGIRAGRVEFISLYAGSGGSEALPVDPLKYPVRLEVVLAPHYCNVRDDAIFRVRQSGILDEPFLDIEPGSSERPVAHPGTVFIGLVRTE